MKLNIKSAIFLALLFFASHSVFANPFTIAKDYCSILLSNKNIGIYPFEFDSSGAALSGYEPALSHYLTLEKEDRFIALERDLHQFPSFEKEVSYLLAFADSFLSPENRFYGMLHAQGRLMFKRTAKAEVQWRIGRVMWSKPKIYLPLFKKYSREEIFDRIFQIAVALKELRLTNSFWPKKRFGFNSFPICIVGHNKACPKESDDDDAKEKVPKEFYKLPFTSIGLQTSAQFADFVLARVQKVDTSIAQLGLALEQINPQWKAPLLERDPHAWLQYSEILKPLSVIGAALAFDHYIDFPLFSMLKPAVIGSAITLMAVYSPLGQHKVSRQNIDNPKFQPGLHPRLHAYWYTSNLLRGMVLSMAAIIALHTPQIIDAIPKAQQVIQSQYEKGEEIISHIDPKKLSEELKASIPRHAHDLQIRYKIEIRETEDKLNNDPKNRELQMRLMTKKMLLDQLLEEFGDLETKK